MKYMYPVLYITQAAGRCLNLGRFPNAGPRPNVAGMRRIYGKYACLIKCGGYLYSVDYATYLAAKGR